MTTFYFQIHKDESFEESIDTFVFVSKEFWEEHGHMDDSVNEQLEEMLPDGFYELCEGVYEFDGDVEEGREALRHFLNVKFIEKKLYE